MLKVLELVLGENELAQHRNVYMSTRLRLTSRLTSSASMEMLSWENAKTDGYTKTTYRLCLQNGILHGMAN